MRVSEESVVESWDYVVVGGGSAGAVVAARLSEDATASVLLIEAGQSGTAPFLQIPNGVYFVKGSARYHWLMAVEPDPTRNNRRETLACGRGLGGGSAINGMVFVKGLRSDFEAWREAGGPDWDVAAVDRAYQKVEAAVKIETPSPVHPVAQLFLESARTYGLAANSTNLMETSAGVMPCPTSAAAGWRQSTARTYLRPIRGRKNLTVATGAVARRLIVESGRVRGVIIERGGKERKAFAGREVILSAGAINTPRILMASGVGPADHLASVGITPVLDLPAVGEGLQDHPCVWISVNVTQKTWNDTLGLGGIALAGAEWLVRRTGPAASGMCHVTLYGSTRGDGAIPDYQMSFMPAGYVVLDHGVKFLPRSSASAAVSLCRPVGRGSVRLRSADPDVAPVISYRLLDGDEDIRTLREACRAARAIYASAPMRDSIVDEAAPGQAVQTDDEWTDYIRRHAVNMCHPVGSCRMGSDNASVVDPRLRLRGLEGLRIADASIMPRITSGNTNAPSIMIGERAAEFIREEHNAVDLRRIA